MMMLDANCSQLWAWVSSNNDGRLVKRELAAGLEAQPALSSIIERAGLSSKWYVLELLDANADGKVSWDEFRQSLENRA